MDTLVPYSYKCCEFSPMSASLSSTNLRHVDSARGTYVLASTPLITLLERWETELRILTQRLPRADITATLTTCHEELANAMQAARDTTLFITVDDAARIANRCRSAMTRLCRAHGNTIGARRIGGVWSIDKNKLQTFLTGESRRTHG